MIFEDRESTYPNRYLITAEDGSTARVILERADEPIKVGTPLNAETLNAAFNEKAPAVESADFPGCYYRTVNGETEWLNPPMVVGVEYRTTERRMGKPVYTKLFNLGAMGAGEKSIKHGLALSGSVFRQEAVCSGWVLPKNDGASRVEVGFSIIEWYNADSILATEDLYVQLWYTKN